jgi:hypothetical protein
MKKKKLYNPHHDGFHHIVMYGRRIIFAQWFVIAGLVVYILVSR